jgi:hypothetical protein
LKKVESKQNLGSLSLKTSTFVSNDKQDAYSTESNNENYLNNSEDKERAQLRYLNRLRTARKWIICVLIYYFCEAGSKVFPFLAYDTYANKIILLA